MAGLASLKLKLKPPHQAKDKQPWYELANVIRQKPISIVTRNCLLKDFNLHPTRRTRPGPASSSVAHSGIARRAQTLDAQQTRAKILLPGR